MEGIMISEVSIEEIEALEEKDSITFGINCGGQCLGFFCR